MGWKTFGNYDYFGSSDDIKEAELGCEVKAGKGIFRI